MNEPKWLIGTYSPVTLFSLRATETTSSGGSTLLCPTPYAVKMALIDAAFRCGKEEDARRTYGLLLGLDIRLMVPQDAVVQHTFVKVLRESREKGVQYGSSIAFREFCFFRGNMDIALDIASMSAGEADWMAQLMWHVNYFGKRGSFFQPIETRRVRYLPQGYSLRLPDEGGEMDPRCYGLTQYMDDFGNLTDKDFDVINTFSAKSSRLGKHRILTPWALPLRQETTSTRYTHYRRCILS